MEPFWLRIALLLASVCVTVSVSNTTLVEAMLGGSVVLPCTCPKIIPELYLVWQTDGSIVNHHSSGNEDIKTDESYHNRTHLYLSKENLNCSLLLSSLRLSDERIYQCYYKNPALQYEKVKLEVTAPYHCDYFFIENQGIYHCEARGGYPKSEIIWLMNDNVIRNGNSTLTYKDHHTGLYTLSSDLPISVSTTQGLVCCVVNNMPCNHVTQDPPQALRKMSKTMMLIWMLLCAVGLLVLLLALVYHRRCRLACKKPATLSVDTEHGTRTALMQLDAHTQMLLGTNKETPAADN